MPIFMLFRELIGNSRSKRATIRWIVSFENNTHPDQPLDYQPRQSLFIGMREMLSSQNITSAQDMA
jgi:hypothetical protein